MPKRHPSLIPLSREHHRGLLLAFRLTVGLPKNRKPDDSPQEQAADTVRFFRQSLVPHFAAEEDILFPAVCRIQPQAEGLLTQLKHEHADIRQLVDKIEQQASEDGSLGTLLSSLGSILERHIRSEERQLFPLYEAHVSEAEAARLATALTNAIGDGLP